MTDKTTQIKNLLDYSLSTAYTYTTYPNRELNTAPSMTIWPGSITNGDVFTERTYKLYIRATTLELLETYMDNILKLSTRYPNGYSFYYNDSEAYLTFTNDANDSTPTLITDVHENLTEGVAASQDGKTKVYAFKQTESSATQSGFTIAFDTAQTTISIEFYLYVTADADPDLSKGVIIYLDTQPLLWIWTYAGVGDNQQYIRLYKDGDYDQTTYFVINGGWHHWRIEIAAGANTVYFDGVSKRTNTGFAAPSFSSMVTKLYRQSEYCYMDNIDFSWAPGYYTNRSIAGTLSIDSSYPYWIEATQTEAPYNENEWTGIVELKARWAL